MIAEPMATAELAVGQQDLPSRSFGRNIFRAAATVSISGLVVKVVATLKEIVVAGVYGRSDAMDAFLAAFLIPNLLVNVIAESMNQALMPTLVRVRLQQGQQEAQELLANSMTRMVLLLSAVGGAMALTARLFFPVIAWSFPPAKIALSIHIFWVLLPTVLLTGIATNCAAVLNTMERFATPVFALMLVPLSVTAGALLLHRQLGIWAIAWFTVIGAAAQAGAVARSMAKCGYTLSLKWPAPSEAAKEVAHQYGPVLLSCVVASAGLIVDQAFAATLPAGSVSAMVFASRFVGVILTLLAGAVSSAFAPYFSIMVAERDWQGCRAALRRGGLVTSAVSIPISLVLIASARQLVSVTLQHGAFGPRDTEVVASVLAMFAIQVPFYAASRIDYRFVLAMRRTDLILYCGILNLILDVALDILLMRYLGVAGLALATSLWTVSTWAFLRICARRLLARAGGSR